VVNKSSENVLKTLKAAQYNVLRSKIIAQLDTITLHTQPKPLTASVAFFRKFSSESIKKDRS
jgi:hypothetical protein